MSALRSSSTIISVDEKGHNECYRAIRSGNIELLEMLLCKHSDEESIESQELEDILAEAYEELKLRNVPLTDEMELCVAGKLLNFRFFESCFKQNTNVMTLDYIKERASIVIENMNKLVEEYSAAEEIDTKFIFIAKFIAQNIHILKRQLKHTFDRLPWEEIEFCLIAFISSKKCNHEINCLTGCILTKAKILKHLKNFSNCLASDLHYVAHSNQKKITSLLRRSRVRTIEDIKKKRPFFEELYNDFKLIRDIYSLETMNYYIQLAVTADYRKEEGQLVIMRALQVIGENLKNTLTSPKLSISTAKLLLIELPKNTRQILTGLRDSLSHFSLLSKRIAIEGDPDVTFFSQLKNDLNTIGKTVFEILVKNKIMIIQESLKIIVRDENIDQMEAFAKICHTDIILKLNLQNDIDVGFEKLETLTKKLSQAINNKTSYEINCLNEIKIIVDNHKIYLSTLRKDYVFILDSLSTFSEINLNNTQMNSDKIQDIKSWANYWLKCLKPGIKTHSLKNLIKYTMDIQKSVEARNNELVSSEPSLIIEQIIQYIFLETGNVKWVEKLKEKLNQGQKDMRSVKDSIKSDNQVHNLKLDSKLSFLNSILKANGLRERVSLTGNISGIKTNNKLQAVIEMLMLDILEILNSSEQKLYDNILNFDDNSPLLTGKELRNHLAHGNFINDLLTFEYSRIVILNARKLTTENCIRDNTTIGKRVMMNSLSLKKRLEKNLGTVVNQQNMFTSVAEGNLEQFNLLVSGGADIFGRSNDLWTTLHYAAKCSNVEFVKFLIDQNVPANAKDIFGRTALHIASVCGKHTIVEFLVEEGYVDINDIDNSGKTALHLAAKNGHNETVKTLLKNKASTGIRDTIGSSPLHWAVRNNFKDVSEILLVTESNVDINKFRGGLTPLLIAAECGHVELVDYLLEQKANVNARADNRATPLHRAAMFSHEKIINSLILKGANVNAKTLIGLTPLHYAAANSNIAIVKALLDNGADVNVFTDKLKCSSLNCGSCQPETMKLSAMKFSVIDILEEGLTPLHIAAANGQLDIVNILIQNKCNINAVSHTGYTAVHCCAQVGSVDILKILLKKGAKAEALDNDNRTPLHISAMNGRMRALEILISESGDINARDSKGMSAFHYVARNGSKDLVRMFIDKRTEINLQNKEKTTALHIAANENTIGVVQALLEAGADIHATNENELTALHLAVARGKLQIAKMLIENKANIDFVAKGGLTPMHTAVMFGHTKLMSFLIAKGAKVDMFHEEYYTPFCAAVKTTNFGMAKILIEQGADINVNDGQPLLIAVMLGYKDMVVYLLKNENIQINNDANLLHVAALQGHRSIVELLLEHGADINAVLGSQNGTALHSAVTKGHTDVVELLLNKSAGVNIKSNDGTPLHIAVTLGLIDISRNLLENGADTQIKGVKNRTPVELAVARERGEILKLLLQHTPESINTLNNNHFTVLHMAAQTGNMEIVKYLVGKSANIHARDAAGSKPIHIAASSGHKKIVEYFLSCTVDINETNEFGATVLHYAAFGGNTKVVEFLIHYNIKQRKIDVNVLDMYGLMPIHYACMNSCLDVVKLLLNNGAYYNDIGNSNIKLLDFIGDKKIALLFNSIERLFKAVNIGNRLEVERCLNDGACVNAKSINVNNVDETGLTPLHCAIKYGHIDVVKILLSKGAIYNAVTRRRYTPLDFAKDHQIVNIMKLVINSFKNIENGDTTVLDRLNKIEDMDILKAVMNARNRENKTLIVVAIHNNFVNISQADVLSELLEARQMIFKEKYQEAFDVISTALKKKSLIYSSDNPVILDIRMMMAHLLKLQHKYQEALDLVDDIYISQKYSLGKYQKETLETRKVYAEILVNLRRPTESLKVYEKVYMRQKKILSGSDLDILTTRMEMVSVLTGLKRYEEALKMNYELLNIYKQSSGTTDKFYFRVQRNIALILQMQTKNEEALALYEYVYEGCKSNLGPFHKDTLRSLYNKIFILKQTKNDETALVAFEDLFKIQKDKLGPIDLDTLTTQNTIGNILSSQGNINDALQIFTDTLTHRKAILGPNHPDVLENVEQIKELNKILDFQCGRPSSDFCFCQSDFSNAAISGNETYVRSVIDRGYEINARDTHGRTLLLYAVSGGHVQIVELLLNNGADVTVVTVKGNTPLHTAASKKNKDIFGILIRHSRLVFDKNFNVFIDARTTSTGSTSLHVAAKSGSIEIVKSLLEYGATYNLLDFNQRTPRDVANCLNIVKLLNRIDEFFEDARSGNKNINSGLTILKADECRCVLNARNICGKTLLQIALVNGHRNIAHSIMAILRS